jgi:hypothetical protein
MTKHLFKFFTAVITAQFLVLSVYAVAHAANTTTPSCPDYSLDSVTFRISGNSSNVKVGSTLDIYGGVVNKNNFALVDGNVFVKIYKIVNPKLSVEDPSNLRMVDRFLSFSHATVAPHSTSTLSLKWQVPESLSAGDYKITASFIVGDKINFGSIALSDQGVPAFRVTVTGPSSNEVYFDKLATALNGISITKVAFPEFTKSEPVILTVSLKNTTSVKVSVPLKWKVSTGSSVSDASIVDSSLTMVEIPANGSAQASYTIKDTSSNQYQVIAEAKYGDAKAILTTSFSRKDVPGASVQLGAIGLSGQMGTGRILGCVSAPYPIYGGKVMLAIMDGANKNIFTDSFALGSTTLIGFSRDFSFSESSGHLVLGINVIGPRGEKLDNLSVVYPLTASSATQSGSSNKYALELWAATIGALGVVMCLIIRLSKGKK